jgi:hypothetical protein
LDRHFAEVWDGIAAEAFTRFNEVEQLLKHMIKPEFTPKIEPLRCGAIRSIQSHSFIIRSGGRPLTVHSSIS